MRATSVYRVLAGVAVMVVGLAAKPASASPLLLNGSFEAGLASWTKADQVGSEGTFTQQTGTTSPVTGFPVPAPTNGIRAAMTDAEGPGSHVLYQDFVVPVGTLSGFVAFDVFIGNRAAQFVTPTTLDFSTPALNQRARVDIMTVPLDPFSLGPSVLTNVFQTAVGSPLVTGYNSLTFDLSALLAANAGGTLRLRFAEVDNVNLFQFGVDNVRLEAFNTAVPEPATLTLLGVGLTLALARRRRRIQ
jgi:hypothetical protein